MGSARAQGVEHLTAPALPVALGYRCSLVPVEGTESSHDVGEGMAQRRDTRLDGEVRSVTAEGPVPEGGETEGERRAKDDWDASIEAAREDQ